MLLCSVQVAFIAHLSILGRWIAPLWFFLRFLIFPVRVFKVWAISFLSWALNKNKEKKTAIIINAYWISIELN